MIDINVNVNLTNQRFQKVIDEVIDNAKEMGLR